MSRSPLAPLGPPARPRLSLGLSASVVAVALALVVTTPAGAQDGGGTETTQPPAPTAGPPSSVPTTTTTAPPTGSPASPSSTTSPSSSAPSAADAAVRLDVGSIDRLLAEARNRAQQARDAELTVLTQQVAAATALVDAARAELTRATSQRDAAAATTAQRAAVVEQHRKRISGFAADAYMRVGTNRDPVLSRLRVGAGQQDPAYVEAQQTSVYTGEAIEATRSDMAAAAAELDSARAEQQRRETEVVARAAAVDARNRELDERRSAETELRERPLDVAASANVESLFDATGPTILGSSLLTAEDLAAFARSRGRAHPSVDVEELARIFIDEGQAEGVRADLAWVQSLIETGYFSFAGSMVKPEDHNYAGIGACDTCSRGHIYATPQLGARSQIQLLRTYADASATTARLARPVAGRAPEQVGVRGCCATWMALAGVWATNRQYGISILKLYDDLLRFSVQRRDAAAAAAAATPAPATAGSPATDPSATVPPVAAPPAGAPATEPPPS